ncbi:hypothetical protein D3C87_619870 [compost metagenome]
MIGSTNLNRIPAGTPSMGSRVLGAILALDDQLKTQQKVRDAERKTYQQDVFVRSRELEAQLARRQA